MDINDIMQIVHDNYPDGYTETYWDAERRQLVDSPDAGDTLALFIVREIFSNYDEDATDEEQLQEAIRAMDAGISTMQEVERAFQEHKDALVDGD